MWWLGCVRNANEGHEKREIVKLCTFLGVAISCLHLMILVRLPGYLEKEKNLILFSPTVAEHPKSQ